MRSISGTTAASPWASAASYWKPDHVVESAWLEHGPFAFWLVDVLRPGVLVELGTHNGYSFFAFCQAIRRLASPTVAFAVDTWRGDDHAGFYDDEIFEAVEATRAARYDGTATLLRGYFDDFVDTFQDGTIDLLHIDGRHGYEDVKHDFDSWRPKMSARGIVVFHDIEVRERGFGVWQFWDEVVSEFPSFSFQHGHGLGVIAVGKEVPEAMASLFSATDRQIEEIRSFYGDLGGEISGDYYRGVAIAGEMRAIRDQLAQTDQALTDTRAELAAVLESFAWRSTRPLRWFTGALPKGLRSRLKPRA